ncbi:MAG TPA: Wzz/FepE/Etk N-terminal domain-containing protein [Bacteroidia bacterium]|nr:Wzz/FepE/Etk N-terminal domain-containing protein [Bacteroidia bacterium]
MNNSFFNSTELVRSIFRWKKHLIIVGLISLGASILFSSPLFIKPKYKSYALVYPSNLIAYSTESATEQMLQLAQSSDIRDKVIRDFNLFGHYEIDTVKNKHFRTDVIKMYEENVTIKKTEYESMEITVLDENPEVASNIVDSIIHFFDVKARSLQAEKSAEVMVIAKNQLDQKLAQMDSMEERLRTYRTEYGILDYKEQSKEALRGYLRGLSSNNNRASSEAKKMILALGDKGGEFNALNEHLWRVRGTYNDLKLVYENAVRDVTKKLTYANVVTRPQPADKKAYPIRWLIVLISVGSSLFLAFMLLLVFNSRQELKK